MGKNNINKKMCIKNILYTYSSWNLRFSNYKEAAFLALYAMEHGKPLKNVKTNKYIFGAFNDEVSTASYKGIPIVFFQGSDANLSVSKIVDTYKEWDSNRRLYFERNPQAFQSFTDQVHASLPNTHKGPNVVLVGYSRGGFTMSAYALQHASRLAIYVACPGDLTDIRKTSKKVYSFGHIRDPVYMLSVKSPLRVHVRKVFRGNDDENPAKVHLMYTIFLKSVASQKNLKSL